MQIKQGYLTLTALVLSGLLPHTSFATSCCDWTHGKFAVQAGAAFTNAGESKHININGLIGNDFSVTSHDDTRPLIGLGYYVTGPA